MLILFQTYCYLHVGETLCLSVQLAFVVECAVVPIDDDVSLVWGHRVVSVCVCALVCQESERSAKASHMRDNLHSAAWWSCDGCVRPNRVSPRL